MRLLSRFGVKTVGKTVSLKEALKMKRPIVLKADTSEHKFDKKLLYVGLKTDAEIKQAYEKIKEQYDVYVQPVLKGFEFLIGATIDPTFGPVILFGMGGTYTELFKDIAFRSVPLTREDANELVEELNVSKIFKGFRTKKYDKTAVVDALLSVSKLISEINVKELDINPLMVNETGAYAIDARVIM